MEQQSLAARLDALLAAGEGGLTNAPWVERRVTPLVERLITELGSKLKMDEGDIRDMLAMRRREPG